ncbi:uncharacterized protein LOC131301127 isoform X1 [Rhododendron vialii]|uniref:uncharacterized protein LOC131301127 isoform X1 n=1 Tax=Rhododendron vialii TaxID=182163 RepID=UPI00265EE8D9|nr:uncharacterized protein LOC131301127 isoform X1 [Rhododendron vialii]XP_058183276.1 uncharacterized protein LOC131301127 isoform X1 [Rhododendron vialii]
MRMGRKRMDTSKDNSIERIISQRALQMGNSFPCQICVGGFLIGVCFTSLFLSALLTSLGTFAFGGISFSKFSNGITSWNSTSDIIQTEKVIMYSQQTSEDSVDERVSFLYSAWSALLDESTKGEGELPQGADQVRRSNNNVPKAPHLEDCKLSAQLNKKLDKRVENERFPPWTLWKGLLDTYPSSTASKRLKSNGAYPPWITGSDEENYPLTRKVQRDIWIHQHPPNCNDPRVKFLVADSATTDRLGMGAQFNKMCGFLAMAIKQRRVLVMKYYNRADHDGCRGPLRSSWSCYFFPETSQECRERAWQLMKKKKAWEKGIITGRHNYSNTEIWLGQAPRAWGEPWIYLQPTTDVNGMLIASHRRMNPRWWRAQALRYLMRFQTEYTCNLLNAERHSAFGREAAKLVLATPSKEWLEEVTEEPQSDIERFVWSNHKPWMPRPYISMHVRMGDKAREMKIVGFEEYMNLAERTRKRFPHVHNILVSTEMQEVIDKLRSYPHWNFYYTNVTRQVGNMSMAAYTASLGRKTSTNYPLVNFLMAVESDFFIGALGSSWSYLIDGMRNTGGKVMAGYLSVNKDRHW